MKIWFRMLAAAFKSEATAQSLAGISFLALAIYTGNPSHYCLRLDSFNK